MRRLLFLCLHGLRFAQDLDGMIAEKAPRPEGHSDDYPWRTVWLSDMRCLFKRHSR